MPWLDQIVILQDGRLIQNDNPEETYKHPYNTYVAKLFGEVNIFNENEISDFQIQKFSYYPHEITISENGFEAEVLESRFAGNHFWNKIKVKDKEVVVYTAERLENPVKISFVNK